jgi:hypothetical protein
VTGEIFDVLAGFIRRQSLTIITGKKGERSANNPWKHNNTLLAFSLKKQKL